MAKDHIPAGGSAGRRKFLQLAGTGIAGTVAFSGITAGQVSDGDQPQKNGLFVTQLVIQRRHINSFLISQLV
ncbi:hypothetical protein [Natrinema sp. DC36]|uniref:hypothetical protein n=1 Tax=Natrinema sp. DC36 TaxID=2878680 RepID=UPI001CEFC856|nr:hypothetical protein [Natrinema sp. DC36]